jgi:hypothetical protein
MGKNKKYRVGSAKTTRSEEIAFKILGINFNNGSRKNNQLRSIPTNTKAPKGRNLATVKEAPKFKRNSSKVFMGKKKREQRLP